MAQILYAPDNTEAQYKTKIFLAGSIEMGKAENWQEELISHLKDRNLTIYNPRRLDWDSSWEQKIENPKFREQVEWELEHLEKADIVVMYLAPNTISPISLLELGLHTKKLVICCPEGFSRKGNVDIVAARYRIPITNDKQKLIEFLKNFKFNE